jgi:hypothetical protein
MFKILNLRHDLSDHILEFHDINRCIHFELVHVLLHLLAVGNPRVQQVEPLEQQWIFLQSLLVLIDINNVILVFVNAVEDILDAFIIYFDLGASHDAPIGNDLSDDIFELFEAEVPGVVLVQKSKAKLKLFVLISVNQDIHYRRELHEVDELIIVLIDDLKDPVT